MSGLAVGDRVMGIMPAAFGPIAKTDHDFVVPLPADWSFEQGASVPIVFATAYYGLIELAKLKSGESVLIHAGAGGVGMAAIQIARSLGAEVFATASPQKWQTLKELGLDQDHIASSRDLEFKDKFLDQTNARGVDVVLNSLAHEFVDASLELLPGGGRFIEMGKTDIRDPEKTAKDHPGVDYRAFDLVKLEPKAINEMLTEILGMFERGTLSLLPISSWDLRQAPQALRFMSQARHTGKIVLTMPPRLDPTKTVLITGATGTLGALVARHLAAEHEITQMVLASRRGPRAAGAKELKSELEALGCAAKIVACDVSKQNEVAQLIDSIDKAHPLGAVIHTAGALDDGVITALDHDASNTCWPPS